MNGRSRAGVVRLVLLVALVALFAVGVASGVTPGVDEVRGWVEAAGPAAPLVFVAVCAAGSSVLVPKPVLSVLGGVLFGPWLGAGVVVVGVTLGALGGFALSRGLGRDVVRPDEVRPDEARSGEIRSGEIRSDQVPPGEGRLARVDRLLERHGFAAVVALRLLPVVPFGLVNYTAGLTGVRVGSFAAGTALGVVPATAVYTATGASLTTMTPGQWLLAGAAVALPALVGFALLRVRRAR
ncbi:TVP38/TMEM64 family protein [Saccharothrix lopnurensis]|uniref:TVP38/TMEM64 family membrane protein n=1 Tax=Saccharothrix lopnurensis TaxID=1670621 RepID=A0ABW1PHY9_9PSEU